MILTFILQNLCHLLIKLEKNFFIGNLLSCQFEPSLRLGYVLFMLAIEGDESYAEARILLISQSRSVFLIDLVCLKQLLHASFCLERISNMLLRCYLTLNELRKGFEIVVFELVAYVVEVFPDIINCLIHLLVLEIHDKVLKDPDVISDESMAFLYDQLDLFCLLTFFKKLCVRRVDELANIIVFDKPHQVWDVESADHVSPVLLYQVAYKELLPKVGRSTALGYSR